ncbi:protein-glutamine glutaminase family protein [Fluviicola taffensis]|uniref:protein-glutamine glutaminase family protein n=1 Tax=Fluviicola taffensis TaxID=191579 RepID=UPI003137BE77
MKEITQFKISFNQGFGSLPTFTQYSDNDLLSIEQAENAFNYVKNDLGIEWRYSYAGCEKRVHAVSLLLKGKNVKHYKIWNFDPSMISLFNKHQKPTVNSNAGLSPTVSWRYHVAILVFVEENGQAIPMVIDPSLNDLLLTQQQWLELQKTPTSYYIHLDPQWYNYATTDKFKYFCQGVPYPFPPCMDGILTGDFFLNNDVSLTGMWVEEALAVNQLAMEIITEIINNEPVFSEKRNAFTKLVEDFDDLTNALKGNPTDGIRSYVNLLQSYQNQFITIRDSWKTKLDALR